MMESIENKREFTMKYCFDLEDHVVVITSGDTDIQNKICLSSHLCPADMKMSCGHGQACVKGKNGESIF